MLLDHLKLHAWLGFEFHWAALPYPCLPQLPLQERMQSETLTFQPLFHVGGVVGHGFGQGGAAGVGGGWGSEKAFAFLVKRDRPSWLYAFTSYSISCCFE